MEWKFFLQVIRIKYSYNYRHCLPSFNHKYSKFSSKVISISFSSISTLAQDLETDLFYVYLFPIDNLITEMVNLLNGFILRYLILIISIVMIMSYQFHVPEFQHHFVIIWKKNANKRCWAAFVV